MPKAPHIARARYREKARVKSEKRAQDLSDQSSLARISEISNAAQSIWLGFLSYIGFAVITLLSVVDVDFFVPSRQTALPLIGISIPTRDFFIFGPILGTILFLYLHFYLLKLWEALGCAPLHPSGSNLRNLVKPWLVNDLGIVIRNDVKSPTPITSYATSIVTALLLFAAGPVLISAFWIRYWPAHDFHLSLLVSVLVFITFVSSGVSGIKAIRALRNDSFAQSGTARFLIVFLCMLALTGLVGTTGVKTSGSPIFDKLSETLSSTLNRLGVQDTSWISVVSADLSGSELAPKPNNWKSYQAHFQAYRDTWCKRRGFTPDICGEGQRAKDNSSTIIKRARNDWCKSRNVSTQICEQLFSEFERDFVTDWTIERLDHLATLPQIDLRGRDLRGANMSDAFLPGADLRNAKLDGVQLDNAIAEFVRLDNTEVTNLRAYGADLRHATFLKSSLNDTEFRGANLQFANFSGDWIQVTKIGKVDFYEANLTSTTFGHSEIGDADFQYATLIETDFSNAALTSSNFARGELTNVNFGGAVISLTDFWYTKIVGGEFRNATFQSSLIDNATIDGASFYYTKFQDSLVNNSSFLNLYSKENWSFDSSVSFFSNIGTPSIPKCWDQKPENFDRLIDIRVRHDRAKIVDEGVRKSYYAQKTLCR